MLLANPIYLHGEGEGEGEVAQSCPSLCNPVDCSLTGFSVHGILQARILEWVTISFSRGSSNPGIEPWYPALEADALTSEPPGKPIYLHDLTQIAFKELSVILVSHFSLPILPWTHPSWEFLPLMLL